MQMATEQLDLIVRGGTIVDGAGGEPYTADIGVAGGRIAAIGAIAGTATEEIDATGFIVTPGFVDIHTHYDGQVMWQNTLSPSSLHGVTSVVMGNCGVGFAPCRPEQRELLVAVMEGVEDIPGIVMTDGLPWNWETFPQFLDALEERECDVDFAAQVPHAPVRVYVMGRRGATREPATAADMAQMATIVREGVAAGALGFTTSRTLLHRTKIGDLAPTVTAAEEELMAIARALKPLETGVMQMISDFNDATEDGSTDFDLCRRLVEASGRPLSISLTQRHAIPNNWRWQMAFIDKAQRDGLNIRGQVCERPIGLLFGLELSYHPFVGCASYRALSHLPFAEQISELRKPDVRARILAETPEKLGAQPGCLRDADNMYAFGDPPDYAPPRESALGERAKRQNFSALELAYDEMLKQDGHALLYYPLTNFADNTLDVVVEMMNNPNTVLGIGDGGAHVGLVCDASMTTHLLMHWTRDKPGERLPLQTAIRMLTQDTAEAVGLNDRGLLKVGYKADLNVIDYEGLALHAPRVAFDLPSNGRRLIQTADGYIATVLSGTITYRNGVPTGKLPGRLIRGARTAPQQTVGAGV